MITRTLALLIFLATLAAAQSHIEGRVVSTNREPIPRAVVRLGTDQYGVTADDQGKFVFDAIAKGRYALTAEKPGFVNRTLQNDPNAILDLTQARSLKNLTITLTPQSIISGKVLDSDGDPIVGVQVALLREELIPRAAGLGSIVGQTQSDDRGEYRFSNISPGRYYLRVAPRPPTGAAITSASPIANVTTFYPNTTDPSQARRFDVSEGRAFVGADVHVQSVRVFSVSGKAMNSATGKPPGGSMLILMPRGAPISLNGIPNAVGSVVNADGTFLFRDVPPGVYDLFTEPGGTSPSGELLPVLGGAPTEVVVSAANVAGLQASFHPLEPITIIATSDDPALIVPQVRANFTPFEGAPAAPVGARRNGELLQFRASPAKYWWSISDLPEGAYVKSAKFAGQDITRGPLDNTPAAGGVFSVVISAKSASLSGSVQDKSGQPRRDTWVVIWPKHPDLHHYVGGTKSERTDYDGKFDFKVLPPGEYYVAAWEELDQSLRQTPEFLARFNSEASPVALDENARAVANPKLIPRARVAEEIAKLP